MTMTTTTLMTINCVCVDCRFWAWLLDWMSSPPALSDLCIRTLRIVLRRPLPDKLVDLPLPVFVRQCVMLDHILAHFQQ